MDVCIGTTCMSNLFPFIQAGEALRIFQLVTWKKPETIAAALDCQTSRLLPGIIDSAPQYGLKLFALAPLLGELSSGHFHQFSSPKKQSNPQLSAFTEHRCFLFRSEGDC